MAQSKLLLRMIAEPKASFRERYMCETDRRRNRAQRFVHADDNPEKFPYPTIEIPNGWISKRQQSLYIRLTLVTVPNERVSVRCVHPYPIQTEDINVIKDPLTNSLFFPVSDDEFRSGRKSFQFAQKKLTLYQLKNFGPLRYLNSDKRDDQRLDDPTDARNLIEVYQLGQSQLLFSVAEFRNNDHIPVIYDVSSVYSQIMTAVTTTTTNEDDINFRCSPQRGCWEGRDEILMVIPRVDKRKAFTVHFEHPGIDQTRAINLAFVDAKTISFYTPQCPVRLTKDNPTITIPIVVTQNQAEIARVNFVYQSFDICLSCSSNISLTSASSKNSNKRSYSDVSENNEIKPHHSNFNQIENNESDLSSIRKYTSTIRASSPIKSVDQFSLLNDAIRHGDTNVALSLIEQANHFLEQENEEGDTPLLLAAKLNRCKVIKAILKKRPDLAQQSDRQENSLLHLLASVPEDKAKDVIKNIFVILENKTKKDLLSMLNKNGQIPRQIAVSHDNNQCADLLKRKMTIFDNSV